MRHSVESVKSVKSVDVSRNEVSSDRRWGIMKDVGGLLDHVEIDPLGSKILFLFTE